MIASAPAMPSRRATKRASPTAPAKRALHYKVVELSNVDEGALERTLNEWTPRGWAFDGVQFAMRESSKRPAMAFVFFTREGEALPQPKLDDGYRPEHEAAAHLRRLANAEVPPAPTALDAFARLEALAGEGDE